MNYNKIIRTITCLWIFAAITTLPLSLSAQESGNTIEHETGFYYTIQKGDTLWDLSERFFDSPWQWPELWHENDQIGNPHLIYPGERIRLLHKRWIKDTAVKSPVEADKKELTEQKPQKEAPYYIYAAIDGIGFIKKEPVSPSGYIFKSYDDKHMISTGDKVYIKPYGDALLIPGNKFTVYRTLEPIKDKKTRAYIGIQHYLGGIVEITDIEPDIVVGTIVRSFRDMQVNDFLMPYIPQQSKITLTESKKGLDGKIIASEEKATLFGYTDIAFIDKGNNDGVVPGQKYSIYHQEKERIDPKARKYTLLPIINFGTLLVLHTEETTSTVLITRSDRDIAPGANICTLLK